MDQNVINAFKFDGEDLKANRRNRFSAKQRNRLVKEALQGLPLFTGIMLMAWIIIGLATKASPIQVVLAWLIMSVGIFAYFAVHTSLYLVGVFTAQGDIILSHQQKSEVPTIVWQWQPSPTGDYFRLDVEQHYFYITSPAFQALKRYEGRACIVYFFYRKRKWHREILSLEIA